MRYAIPRNKQEWEGLCRDAEVRMPYADSTEIMKSKIAILNKTVHNRCAYQAMEGCDGTLGGVPDTLTRRRYLRFAEGGAGIIWFEATAVREDGRANPRQLYITEENLPAFSRMVNEIKETCMRANGYEPLVVCQLTHSGRYSKPHGDPAPLIAYNSPFFEGQNPIDKSRILSDEQLDRIGEALVAGAVLAERAGFDGADIKCCHRYLLCELLSAYTRENSRYGGSFENRTRLFRESVGGALAACGKDFIVTTRMNIYDGFPYPYGFGVREGEGLTPDFTEAKMLCAELVKMGMPLINMTMGNPYVNPHVNRPFAMGTYEPEEHPMFGVYRMLEGIAEVAATVDVPVISSGLSFLGAAAPNVAAAYIKEDKFQFAGFGRETLAYPDLAKDICQSGGLDAKRLCMTCGKCTEIMRQKGGTPGCVIRDGEVYAPIYRELCLKK